MTLKICNVKSVLSDTNDLRVKAAVKKSALWPVNYTIKYTFIQTPSQNLERTKYKNTDTVDPIQKEIETMSVIDGIKKIIEERINPLVSMSIVYTDDINDADIRISFDQKSGAWSTIGTECQNVKYGATMNFGWYDAATVMHEWGHALGMIHEHQNPNGNLIQWDEEKVYKWASETQGWDKKTTYTNIIEKTASDELNTSVFDPKSIMLYFFPAELTKNNIGTNQNTVLSKGDIDFLASIYDSHDKESVDLIKLKIHGSSNQRYVTGIYFLAFFLVIIGIGFYMYYKK